MVTPFVLTPPGSCQLSARQKHILSADMFFCLFCILCQLLYRCYRMLGPCWKSLLPNTVTMIMTEFHFLIWGPIDRQRLNGYLDQRVPSLLLASSSRKCSARAVLECMLPWRARCPLSWVPIKSVPNVADVDTVTHIHYIMVYLELIIVVFKLCL